MKQVCGIKSYPSSMNRLIYDTCAYSKSLGESVAPMDYMLDIVAHEHCDKCMVDLGLVGGTAVSHVDGSMVDLENDLRGANRPGTKCPSFKFLPSTDASVQGKEYIKPVCHPRVNTTMSNHLKSCKFTEYPTMPPPPKRQKAFVCDAYYKT
jgi:hypothetical protein